MASRESIYDFSFDDDSSANEGDIYSFDFESSLSQVPLHDSEIENAVASPEYSLEIERAWQEGLQAKRDRSERIERFSREVLGIMVSIPGKGKFSERHITEIAASLHASLDQEELHGLVSRLYEMDQVHVNADGSCRIIVSKENEARTQAADKKMNVHRMMTEINRSPAVRRALDSGKRAIEDQQRRGRHRRKRGSRAQGRNHGKSLTFEQLLAKSLKDNNNKSS